MSVMKNVIATSRRCGQSSLAQYVPVIRGTDPEEVISPAADSDIVEGITLLDARWDGEEVPICKQPGSTVLATAGAGGWTKGMILGLDGANLARLKQYAAADHEIIVAVAEEAKSEGELGSCTLLLQRKTA
jgi:hypothetical protein